ncbi:MAG: GIY-YIG nuclease family protein [Rhodospirillales bacterium]|nr:GIY-YIG nuclease family protein [Rhodospirillales bacterium]
MDKNSGKLVYIGESGDLQSRLNQHTRQAQKPTRTDKSDLYNPKKHRVDYKLAKPDAAAEQRRKHERSKIAQHRPPWNKDGGGSGRK